MSMRGANQSRYVSAMITNQTPINANQNDLNALRALIRSDQLHLRQILATRKLYGPMTPEAQIEAVEYAYGVTLKRTKR